MTTMIARTRLRHSVRKAPCRLCALASWLWRASIPGTECLVRRGIGRSAAWVTERATGIRSSRVIFLWCGGWCFRQWAWAGAHLGGFGDAEAGVEVQGVLPVLARLADVAGRVAGGGQAAVSAGLLV